MANDSPTIYEAFFVMKMREATFSSNAGILTGAAGPNNAALVGANGTNAFFNFTFGSTYTYKKNNVVFPAAGQTGPMNAFAVVHLRFTSGIALTDLQIGKDRADAARHAEADIVEIDLMDALLDDLDSEAFSRYLMTYYGIS
jgi:hypothetical protein